MMPIERLRMAWQATLEHRYEEALDSLLWFYHHALEHDPALCGVRRSYALSYWLKLGQAYAPARQALDQLRDESAAALLRGEGGEQAFRDVCAIDETTGRTDATHALYLALLERQPALAETVARAALPAVAAAGNFRLADRIRDEPEARIRRAAQTLREDLRDARQRKFTRAPVRWALIKHYAEGVRRDAAITAGIGQAVQARRLEKLAVEIIPDPVLRRAVRAEIARPSQPPVPKPRGRHGRAPGGDAGGAPGPVRLA